MKHNLILNYIDKAFLYYNKIHIDRLYVVYISQEFSNELSLCYVFL